MHYCKLLLFIESTLLHREKQALLDDAQSCKKKMDAASTLINGLAGERVRWTAQSKEFKAQIGKLIYQLLTVGWCKVDDKCFATTLSHCLPAVHVIYGTPRI